MLPFASEIFVTVGLTLRPLKPKTLAEVDWLFTTKEKDVGPGVTLVGPSTIFPENLKIVIFEVVSTSYQRDRNDCKKRSKSRTTRSHEHGLVHGNNKNY